ncbi:hypothetical protein PLICRDRAFT_102080 [Plicaturopsis crispa FD-325 SS-3]|nr:hypothetical protein PLICRDRAFT_102080 [Plicaturopsis crispa FD-325 SS-3]
MSSPALRLGVDVGGTNTDAVLLDLSPGPRRGLVLASAKHLTTSDVTLGIQNAVQRVLEHAQNTAHIQALSIGTTHFVNALIERDPRRLDKVAVIRLCGPFSRGTPPFVGFPRDLRDLLEGPHFLLSGGLQIDGSEISPVDKAEIEDAAREIRKQNIRAVAIVSVYAPIDFELKQEEHAAAILKEILKDVQVVCSKDVAHIGLLERENAAILNASLLRYARKTVLGFQDAARALRLTCPVFITSNDGTLLNCAQAARLPIRTFSSGPTNSMRGAAFLASLEAGGAHGVSALVADIGGTTTEVGMLLPSGFPRQAAAHHELCGVRLNFSMPHVTSIGLGGGSIVRMDASSKKITVGPDSVGYRIMSEGLVFGGSTLTATDIVVAAGRAPEVGNTLSVSHLEPSLIQGAEDKIGSMLQHALDAMKTSSQELPVYLVGGGSILAPDFLEGISRVHRFPHFDVANAVGAAIAQVSGIVDSIEDISSSTISDVRVAVETKAIARAVAAGADPAGVTIIESEAIPIAYTAGRCRFYVKAAGEWSGATDSADSLAEDVAVQDAESTISPSAIGHPSTAKGSSVETPMMESAADLLSYRPRVDSSGEWTLSEIDLEWIAEGCYVLGCGGGGSSHHMFLQLREMVRHGEILRVVDLSSIEDSKLIGWGGGMGSPEVSAERLLGEEYNEATVELLEFMGIKNLAALCALEIGGGNGMVNMITGSTKYLDIPVVDGDFMGRAYPTGWQTTPNVYDPSGRALNILPCAIASGDGNSVFMTKTKKDKDVDAALRAACTEMGTHVGQANRPLTAKFCRTAMVPNTVSLSWRIGRALALATKQHSLSRVGPILVEALGGKDSSRVLFSGKITDVQRRVYKGHTIGSVHISALAPDDEDDEDPEHPIEHFSGDLVIPFKNENLYAEHFPGGDASSKVIATVPDLICVLDAQSGSALGTPDYKYGLRVMVLGATAAPQWTDTPRGLELGDLRAFGYTDIPYVPLGVYSKPRSVIDEFKWV